VTPSGGNLRSRPEQTPDQLHLVITLDARNVRHAGRKYSPSLTDFAVPRAAGFGHRLHTLFEIGAALLVRSAKSHQGADYPILACFRRIDDLATLNGRMASALMRADPPALDLVDPQSAQARVGEADVEPGGAFPHQQGMRPLTSTLAARSIPIPFRRGSKARRSSWPFGQFEARSNSNSPRPSSHRPRLDQTRGPSRTCRLSSVVWPWHQIWILCAD